MTKLLNGKIEFNSRNEYCKFLEGFSNLQLEFTKKNIKKDTL